MNDYLQRLALRGAMSQASSVPATPPAWAQPSPIAEMSVEAPAAAATTVDRASASLDPRSEVAPPGSAPPGSPELQNLERPPSPTEAREASAPVRTERQTQADAHAVAVAAEATPSVVVVETHPAEALAHEIVARDAPANPPSAVPTADPPRSERNVEIAVARAAPVRQPSGSFAGPGAPRADPVAPAISIGRIQIDLTPPPQLQPARSPPARTRGFSHYARARRGLKS